MPVDQLHRFERDGRYFAIDPETCFCFECDVISWDVLALYPHTPVNRIYHELEDKYDREELEEVVGELEWLRAVKSIFPFKSPEDGQKALLELNRDLRELTLIVRETTSKSADVSEALTSGAISLLLGRSGHATEVGLCVALSQGAMEIDRVGVCAEKAFAAARMAGKSLNFSVEIADCSFRSVPETLKGHALSIQFTASDIEGVRAVLEAWTDPPTTLERVAKAASELPEGIETKVRVRPLHSSFGKAGAALAKIGFHFIEIDVSGMFARGRDLAPEDTLESMIEAVDDYTQDLRAHRYYRVDPFATLFWHIYNGTPTARTDGGGTNALTVNHDGRIYPSRDFPFDEQKALGSVLSGEVSSERVKVFDDVGAATTPVCRQCWTRNLCGGGSAAVHQRLSGHLREPNAAWCDWQRAWMGAAAASFSTLSAEQINFGRVYQQFTPKTQPSLFAMARAAFRMHLGMRPIEEADAEWLARWESWNRSAYFLLNERSIFIGNQYEREMDALHPQPSSLEAVLLRKTGEPMGLFRVGPDGMPLTASGHVYFRDEEDYGAPNLQKSFRTLIKESGSQQSLRFLFVRAAEWETRLGAFLEGVGFEYVGTEREMIFTKGRYHDVRTYRVDLETL